MTRVANYLAQSSIYKTTLGDMIIPPILLDSEAMVNHQFLRRNEQFLQYRLIYDRRNVTHVTLPAPYLFDYQAKGRYVVTREEATEHERRAVASASQEAVAAASQYDPDYNFRYLPSQPWP